MDYTPLDIEYTGPQNASPKARRKVMRRIYRDAREEIPDNVPEIRGKEVQLNIYVDVDHVRNKVTRHSQTGILIFFNESLIAFDSKHQNTVDFVLGIRIHSAKTCHRENNRFKV